MKTLYQLFMDDDPVVKEDYEDDGRRHIVGLSGGKDSTALALRLAEVEPRPYEYICTPTGNELPEMIEHWRNLGRILGSPLRPIGQGVSLGGLIKKWSALPNWRMRWCTRVLKIEPFQMFMATVAPAVCYIGIRADELDRDGVDYQGMDAVEQRFPLQEWGWGKRDVLEYLDLRGVCIPKRTDCAACFFQTLGEWWSLWKNHPEEFAKAEAWEKETGHTFRSDQRDSWAASLRELRSEFESGRRPKRSNMDARGKMCSVCSR